MWEHTNASRACQPPYPDARSDTHRRPPQGQPTATATATASPTERTLAHRYGAPAAVADGWVAIPNVVLRTHRTLGVAGPHWELCEAIWLDWRGEEPPCIALTTLAERLGVSERTVERHTAALEALGVLRVDRRAWVRGHRQLNTYDLRPLIDAALATAHPAMNGEAPLPVDTSDTTALTQTTIGCRVSKNTSQEKPVLSMHISKRAQGTVPAMCSTPNSEAQINAPPLRGGEKGTAGRAPTAAAVHARNATSTSVAAPFSPLAEGGHVDAGPTSTAGDDPPASPVKASEETPTVQLPLDPDDQALVGPIRALVYELGDDAPASSITRGQNMRREAGVSAGQFLRALDEATARTRARQETIRKRRRDGQSRNGMPYLFAVLQDVLAPPAERRLSGRRGRGHGGRQGYEDARRAALMDTYGTYPDPPPADMPAAWRDTLDDLRRSFVACNYVRWLLPTCVLGQEGTVLRIGVPDAFHAHWLDGRLRGLIERTMARTAPGLHVEFVAHVSVTPTT